MSIEVTGLTHRYGERLALDDVSFRVERGQVFGCLGPNGAGKSTTVRILLGLLVPAAGQAVVAGVDVRKDPVGVRERVGYLPEVTGLYESLTAREQLRFVGRIRRLDDALIERRGAALLEAFDLAARGDEPVRGFSKGMRQKLALALALLHRPPVLILDEPLVGLDVTAAMVLKDVLRGLAQQGCAILYCSHVLDVVERVCDRALILSSGKVVAEGGIQELKSRTAGTSLEDLFRSVAAAEDPAGRAKVVLDALSA